MSRALLLLLCAASLAPAQSRAAPDLLTAIPKDAVAAVAFRSIDELRTKYDRLVEDLELKRAPAGAGLVGALYQALKVQGGVDEKAPVVLAVLPGHPANAGLLGHLQRVLLLLPLSNRDAFVKGAGLDPERLRDGKAAEVADALAFRAVALRGGYACYALTPDVLAGFQPAPRPASDAEKKDFADSDVLFYIGDKGWVAVWGGYLDALGHYFDQRKDEVERKVGKQFVEGLRAARHSLIGLRVEGGLRLRSSAVFDVEKREAAREMLATLRAGKPADLAGLPAEGMITALAWSGEGSRNGVLTKLLFDVFLEGPLPLFFNWLPVFATTNYPSVVGVSRELGQRLHAVRAGLYAGTPGRGLVSGVAVLDTTDAAAFLKAVRDLARIAVLTEADLKKPETRELADFARLIRDLDADDFDTREGASTRLLLLDELALPAVREALKKPASLEQARRLQWIREQVEAAAEQRRKEALKPEGEPRAFRPTFALAAAAEKRAGLPIDVIQVTADPKQPFARQLAALFGPDWGRLRVAVVGRKVVVGIGSDPARFDEALANVQGDRPGLAASPLVAGFLKNAAPGRTAELHASAQAYLGFWAREWNLPARLFKGPPEPTSLGIAVGKDELRLDLTVTKAELRAMLHTIFPQGE